MSEKGFKIYQDSIRKFESDRIWGVKSETNSLKPFMTFKEAEKCCDVLNEQQATIHSLKEEVRLLKPTNIEQYEQIVQLQEENEQLKKELLRIQKTILSIQKEINNYYNEVCSNE